MTADATRLPFTDGAFDAVLIRDVLHHIGDIAGVLAEARRVLRAGGRLTLLEPNRASPFILMQAALIPAERGVLRSTARGARGALWRMPAFASPRAGTISRFPSSACCSIRASACRRWRAIRWSRGRCAAADAVARRLLPERAWMYLVFEATVP